MFKHLFGKKQSKQASKTKAADIIEKINNPENEYEICISCGQTTDVKVSTPIYHRTGYISGCGQMCLKCYQKLKNTNSFNYSPEQLEKLRDICINNDKN